MMYISGMLPEKRSIRAEKILSIDFWAHFAQYIIIQRLFYTKCGVMTSVAVRFFTILQRKREMEKIVLYNII